MNTTSILRLALEGSLGIGTITGGACAVEYGRKAAYHKSNWKMWMQYSVACLNSIIEESEEEEQKDQASNCKTHLKPRLEKIIDINWDHKEPQNTPAAQTPEPS